VTPLDHRLDRRHFALEDGFDAAIVEVTDPAVDAALAGGIAGVGAVEDALYLS
jgi:hypothetical protein